MERPSGTTVSLRAALGEPGLERILAIAVFVLSLLGCDRSSQSTTPSTPIPCADDGACPAGTHCERCLAPPGCEGVEGEDERCDECVVACVDECGGCPASQTCDACPTDPECPECDVCGEPVCR